MTHPLARLEDDAPLALDLEKLIGSHLCILANSGAGKSGAIRKVLEVTHGAVQHIVIDTEDEFYTLRERFDYLIAGGENGDCAATVNNAAALATTILETGFSAIVQINSLPMPQRCAFISAFLQALTDAPKRLWRPALVVLDEAQFYAPQKGFAASHDAIVSFMMLGRKRGFTGILASPRPADLSKQATSPVNNWLIGRCGQPADRRSAADALGFTSNSPEARNLRSLVARQFWTFGPALTNEPVLARIEKTETTIVKAGQATLPTPPAPAAMQKILASLNAAAVEKKEEPATHSPGESSASPVSMPDPSLILEAETRGFSGGFEAGVAKQAENVGLLRARVETVFAEFLGGLSDRSPPTDLPRPQPVDIPRPLLAEPPRMAPAVSTEAVEITGAMKETMQTIAWWHRLGHRAPTRKQVCGLLGIPVGGSTMRGRMAALSKAGLIEYPTDSTVALTAAGVAASPPVQVGRSIVETVRDQLSPAQQETFDAIPAPGKSITRSDLGEKLGGIPADGSTMRGRLAELSNRELIEYPKPGLVARQEWVRG